MTEGGQTVEAGPVFAPAARAAAADLVVQTSELRKAYGAKVAVSDLTIGVRRGEVFGFLGPNGAGKSTAVKMLVGLVRPTGGTARVLGRPSGDPEARARIGFLPEHFRFHEWLTAAELLEFHGRLYGMEQEARRRRVPELLERVGLEDAADTPLSAFSKGMLQRVGLAQALLNDPDLLFLDEPTSALDPFGRILVREVIREVRARGATVFLNSHLLGEVEATCDRVCFIRAGAVLRTVDLDGLETGLVQVELRVDAVTPALLQSLGGVGVQPAAGTDRTIVRFSLPDEDLLPAIAERTVASGARLFALVPRRLSLEELFVDVVGEDSGA